jgi:DNA-binding MarR family transcriptional regulator
MAALNPLPISQSLFFRMVLAVNLTARPFARLYGRKYNLNLTESRVMITLASAPGTSANDIARLSGLDKMTVSRSLASMIRCGYVDRRNSPEDRRRWVSTLTAKGRRVYGAIAPRGAVRETVLLADFTAAERTAFGRLLDGVVARARRLPDE